MAIPVHNLEYMNMRSSRCAFSTAAALHRIFIAPIEHSSLCLPRQPHLVAPPRLYLPRTQQRSYASLPPPAKFRLPRGDEIEAAFIHLVSEDGKLSLPQSTSSILSSLDRQTETLITVASPSPASPNEPSIPICKIISKKTLHEAERARSKSKKKENPSATLKTIELNWAIDAHDLNYRLERVREFLGKGWRVDIVMAGKKRGRKASVEEAEQLVGKVRSALREVEGAREWKAMEGRVGTSATIFAEGKVQLAEK